MNQLQWTWIQQVSAAYWFYMANPWLFSFFASNLRIKETNRIQREFYSNVAIASQEFSSASKQSRKKTNLSKPSSVGAN